MEWVRNYLVRKRDQASVSYSRFGRPGEEEEERPPPTTIMIAPFDENHKRYKVFGFWHIEKAAASFAVFGLCMVILVFISTFFEFDWYHHQRGVDASALFGLFFYLAIGVLVHYYVLYGIKKQTAYYLLPFIIVYICLITAGIILAIAVCVKMVEPKDPIHPPFGGILSVVLLVISVQSLMLHVILRCRDYLCDKCTHDLEVKVAEKGRAQNPDMQIVVVGATGDAPTQTASENGGTTTSVENPSFNV